MKNYQKRCTHMNIEKGTGDTKYGAGVCINLSGDDVATAIMAWLVAHNVYIKGARTIRVNGELCQDGDIYVDPSGFVISDGEKYDGRTGEKEIHED